jgi:hypothetical protein
MRSYTSKLTGSPSYTAAPAPAVTPYNIRDRGTPPAPPVPTTPPPGAALGLPSSNQSVPSPQHSLHPHPQNTPPVPQTMRRAAVSPPACGCPPPSCWHHQCHMAECQTRAHCSVQCPAAAAQCASRETLPHQRQVLDACWVPSQTAASAAAVTSWPLLLLQLLGCVSYCCCWC